MKKLLFIDKDDVIVKSAPFIQDYMDKKTPYKSEYIKSYDDIISNCQIIYEDTIIKCNEAKKTRVVPNLLAVVDSGSNDIIRTSLKGKTNSDKVLYEDPIERKKLALEMAKFQKQMFLESRDHFLEEDNLKNKEEGIVDYDSIYVKENVSLDVYQGIIELYTSGYFSQIYELSHHNGGRELFAKKQLNKTLFGDNIPFLGLRFHLEEYKKGIRRERSSKAMYVKQLFHLDDLSECYLIDDSVDNVREWLRCGGKAILYKPYTPMEALTGILEDSKVDCPRIFEFDKETILEYIDEENNQGKVYIK